ncbi:TAXI family TRAP transporter solute-binding subunit [Chromohalobacter israelensis]|uniref:TAXI family TRAP transporter solute-binding subunit n=1 Tax=Chromohalobacter israelensis TaxID=141390 RepID=UPI001CC5C5F1|nr:TAXI family TRAP transporter solute-binding subunit [Chromohalobacter salexigens]MBZ5876217.1 TAXI family TRAP transporter solute-binding subunit [Chromohalobacter salexigens]
MLKRVKTKSLATALVSVALSISTTTASADILAMGGNPAGSLFYAQAQAIAATVGKHTNMRVDVLPQSGTAYFPMFMTGEVDVGIASPIEAKLAFNALETFEGANNGAGYDMKTIMLGSPIRLSLVTREDSGIDSLKELKGKRVVADYGAFAGATLTARSVLANAGLTTDDVQVVAVSSYPEGVRAVMEGRADAAVGSLGSGILQELDAAVGAKMLEIDPSSEAMARTKEVGEAFVPLLVDKGPVGIDDDTHVLSYSTTIYARPELEDKKVKKFIEALWENYEELPAIHRSLTTWTPDRFANTDAVIPYHPAAVNFYREKGVWDKELEARQAKLSEE